MPSVTACFVGADISACVGSKTAEERVAPELLPAPSELFLASVAVPACECPSLAAWAQSSAIQPHWPLSPDCQLWLCPCLMELPMVITQPSFLLACPNRFLSCQKCTETLLI